MIEFYIAGDLDTRDSCGVYDTVHRVTAVINEGDVRIFIEKPQKGKLDDSRLIYKAMKEVFRRLHDTGQSSCPISKFTVQIERKPNV